jgi:Ger(x)C family germination protein
VRRRWLLLGLAVLLLTTGCWDARPIDRRAFVVMVGIDKTPAGMFRVSLQLQKPTVAEPRGSKGGTQTVVLTHEGETVEEAISKTGDDLARQLDLTFLDVIVIGRTAAADLADLNWVVRPFQIETTAFVVVAEADAESVVRAKASGFNVPAQFALFSLLSGSWSTAPTVPSSYMWLMFNRSFYTHLEDPYAAVLTAKDGELRWNGLAAFHGHSLAGYLTSEEAAMFNLLMGTRSGWSVSADLPGRPGVKVSMQVTKAKVKRSVTWQADRPVIHLQISVRGQLAELSRIQVTTVSRQQEVERAAAAEVARRIQGLVAHLQTLGSDPVGFGELARQNAPYRREVQSDQAWHTAWQSATVDVRTQATLVSPGYMR